MTLLCGALTMGLLLSLLVLGVYVSFRVFDFPDITPDGSFALGGAVSASLMAGGADPLAASLAAFAAGALAGASTGVLHTRFRIHGLLAGILVMTSLYSINLHVMGRSNVPLLEARTLPALVQAAAGGRVFRILGWDLSGQDLAVLVLSLALVLAVAALLRWFFATGLGSAMRATGDNPQMVRAMGVDHRTMIVLGLALSNGLVALSGSLLAQYQGFADVQMGIGMVVLGFASVIIGEAMVRTRSVGLAIAGAVMGSILFRLLVAIALRFGLDPNDLKLTTAVFVFLALVGPGFLARLRRGSGGSAHA